MQLTNYISNTFALADDDILNGEVLLREGGTPNGTCFLSQQAAEKYFKGFLAAHENKLRKVHDLKELLGECEKIDPSFSELLDDVIYLNRFYIKTRYADDFHAFSSTDAKKALASAQKIKEFVLAKITP